MTLRCFRYYDTAQMVAVNLRLVQTAEPYSIIDGPEGTKLEFGDETILIINMPFDVFIKE